MVINQTNSMFKWVEVGWSPSRVHVSELKIAEEIIIRHVGMDLDIGY